MNSLHTAPSLSRSRVKKMERKRTRPGYPKIEPGTKVIMERDKIGLHEFPVEGKRKLFAAFSYSRAPLPVARSKYVPHEGRKELIRGGGL